MLNEVVLLLPAFCTGWCGQLLNANDLLVTYTLFLLHTSVLGSNMAVNEATANGM